MRKSTGHRRVERPPHRALAWRQPRRGRALLPRARPHQDGPVRARAGERRGRHAREAAQCRLRRRRRARCVGRRGRACAVVEARGKYAAQAQERRGDPGVCSAARDAPTGSVQRQYRFARVVSLPSYLGLVSTVSDLVAIDRVVKKLLRPRRVRSSSRDRHSSRPLVSTTLSQNSSQDLPNIDSRRWTSIGRWRTTTRSSSSRRRSSRSTSSRSSPRPSASNHSIDLGFEVGV